MNNLNKINIQSIDLIAAAGCDLKCNYCVLHRTKNNYSNQLLENTKKSFQDQTYLKNVLKGLERLETSPLNIKKISIWGQESTIILKDFEKDLENWINNFPNLDSIFFSTNGLGRFEDIFSFILTLDSLTKHKFSLDIQISYDGNYGTKEARGGNGEIILENILTLIEKINKISLKNVNVTCTMHGVVSRQIIHSLIDYEDIYQYLLEINNTIKIIKQKIINKNFYFGNITLQYENAIKASYKDGIALNNFTQKVERVLYSNIDAFPYLKERFLNGVAVHILGGFLTPLSRHIKNWDKLENYLSDIISGKVKIDTPFCAPILNCLKIMYDGTLLTCQNSMFDAYHLDEELISNSVEDQSRSAYIKHGQKVNVISGTDEEIEQYINYVYQHLHGGNMRFMITSIANLLLLLSSCGQIDISYSKNIKKTYLHAFLMANLNCCYYNLLIFSGSSLIRNTGEIRFLCNGIMDQIEDNVEKELKIINERNIF